jgi:hypothetical protein
LRLVALNAGAIAARTARQCGPSVAVNMLVVLGLIAPSRAE